MTEEERLKHPRPFERFTNKELEILENLLKAPGGYQRQYVLLRSVQEEIDYRLEVGKKVLSVLNKVRLV